RRGAVVDSQVEELGCDRLVALRLCSPGDEKRRESEQDEAAHAPRVATYPVRLSNSFALFVSTANPACSTSFAPAVASVHVSSRPNCGAMIWVPARPAAIQVPMQREQVTSSPTA